MTGRITQLAAVTRIGRYLTYLDTSNLQSLTNLQSLALNLRTCHIWAQRMCYPSRHEQPPVARPRPADMPRMGRADVLPY